MGEMQDLRDEINGRLSADMQAHGFRKRAGSFYTRDLDDDALCLVTVSASVSRLTQLVDVIPHVGVRIHAIERLVSDLGWYRRHSYYPSTASVTSAEFAPRERIGHSVPAINWWMIETMCEADQQVPLIVQALAVDGLEWAEKHRSLDELIVHMRSKPGDVRYHTRLPVALVFAGRHDEARQALDDFLAQGLYRTDGAMDNYRRFAIKFRSLVL